MSILFINSWFTDAVAKAIGWTLIHSLWQGLILAVISGIVILLTRRSSSSLRYSFLCITFILFIITSCITFFSLLQPAVKPSSPALMEITDHGSPAFNAPVKNEFPAVDLSTSIERFSAYFDKYATLIAAMWLIIFMVKFVMLIANIGYVRRIRHDQSFAIPGWQNTVTELARKIKISKPVLLLESGIVKVPVVIGFIKPAIMVPLGLLSNLPGDQVEAILLHELAHIRRKDYLVNLLQCFAETIFFFNPAVLWLSSVIRQKREDCCDDIAITVTRKKLTFIRALLAFQEHREDYSLYAPAFPGRKQHLLERVKRIVYNNNKNLNNREKIFLASGLVVTTLVVLSFSANHAGHKNNSQTGVHPVVSRSVPVASSTNTIYNVRNFTDTIVTVVDERLYRLELKNGIISALYIEGQKIPEEKIGIYKAITDKIIDEYNAKVAAAKKNTSAVTIETENAKQAYNSMDNGKVNEPALRMEMSKEQREMLEKQSKKVTIETENLKVKQYQESLRPQNKTNNSMMNWTLKHEEALRSGKQPEMSRQQQEILQKQAKQVKMKAEISGKQVQSLLDNITTDLVKDNVIHDKKSIFFQLNTDVLIVNDIKQPEPVRQKFKNKYLKSSEDHIVFLKKENSDAIVDLYFD